MVLLLGGGEAAFGLEGEVSMTSEEGRCTLNSVSSGTLSPRQASVRGIWLPWQPNMAGRHGTEACLCPKGKPNSIIGMYLEWSDLRLSNATEGNPEPHWNLLLHGH